MWEIYDELINMIPEELTISSFTAGVNWFLVDSIATGMAMTPREGNSQIPMAGKVAGTKVKETAKLIKSWSNYEAALGLAAINSVINRPEAVEKLSGIPIDEQVMGNAFEYMKERIRGKKVAVIGHFRDLEQLQDICQLSILERIPQNGDFPDPSCEYILPEQDFVFITGTTLINKTLPRLLELSKKAFVVLVGPSTPMTANLFKYGIDMLAGTVVMERDYVQNLIKEGGSSQFFEKGARMVKCEKKDAVDSKTIYEVISAYE